MTNKKKKKKVIYINRVKNNSESCHKGILKNSEESDVIWDENYILSSKHPIGARINKGLSDDEYVNMYNKYANNEVGELALDFNNNFRLETITELASLKKYILVNKRDEASNIHITIKSNTLEIECHPTYIRAVYDTSIDLKYLFALNLAGLWGYIEEYKSLTDTHRAELSAIAEESKEMTTLDFIEYASKYEHIKMEEMIYLWASLKSAYEFSIMSERS